MNEAFNAVLTFTPWISAIIILIFAVRRIFGNKLSANFFRLCWLVLAIRLVLPFDVSVPQAPVQIQLPQIKSAAPSVVNNNAEIPQPNNIIKSEPTPINLQSILTKAINYLPIIWLIIAALYFGTSLASYLFYVKKLRKNARLQTQGELYTALGGKLPLYEAPHCASPVLIGYLRPAIYVPQKQYSKNAAESVIKHELTHYKRGDLWLQLLLLCAVSLSWFNPLVHLMRKKALCDIEMAVDETLLKNTDIIQRRAYGDILFEEVRAGGAKNALSAGYSSGNSLKERFAAILSVANKKNGKIIIAAVCAVCVSASLLISCGVQDTKEEKTQSISAKIDTSQSETAQQDISQSTQNTADNSDSAPSEDIESEPNAESNLIMAQNDNISFQNPLGSGEYKVTRINANGHTGADIEAPYNTEVYAAKDGKIIFAGIDKEEFWARGNFVEIEHENGISTIYCQLEGYTVKNGDEVSQGQLIGHVGNTGHSSGPHLHFEAFENGESLELTIKE